MSQSSFHQSIAAVAQAPGQFLQNAKANGLIKRNSIFSRPSSRNGSVDLESPSFDPTRPSLRSVSTCQASPRPSTSSGVMERSHTDPSLSKRHSLFGSRRRSNRKNERDEEAVDAESAPKNFKSDDEYQSYLRKQSISLPFNFQHLSSSRRRHVPGLATVDEKGIPRAPSGTNPRLSTSSRPVTPCLPEPGQVSHHASSRSVDVLSARQFLPVDSGRPRAASCQSRPGLDRNALAVSQVVSLSVNNPNLPSDSEHLPPFAAQVQHCSPSEVKYRAQQPLPALPQRAGSKRDSKRMTMDSQVSCSTSGSTGSAPDSRRSSQLVRPATAGPWSIRDERGSTAGLSEASWEEDVDFCYKQEAESTCDFNWDELDEENDNGFRLSRYLPPTDGLRASALFASAPQNTSPLQRCRSSIVGHRGFQHARTTSIIHEAPDHEAHAQKSQEHLVTGNSDSKPLCGPEVMHLGTSIGSISDGASTRTGSSGHHKSSSCASYESGIRPAPPGSDNGHSSVASLNSVPELTHSTTACSSTDAVASLQETEAAAPQSTHLAPACDIVRKPSTLSNRAILQAGRVVQRGRGSSNAGRAPFAQTQRPLVEAEEVTTWI